VPITVAGARYQCYLVLFHDAATPPPGAWRTAQPGLVSGVLSWVDKWRPAPQPKQLPGEGNTAEIDRLHQEHEATKEFLQSLLDERESSNEELRAANEEVLSSNEELQSTNEELETAKEELQSVNEELTTVNEQLNARNAELTHINNDFSNLLTSTDIPLVAVGSDLRIRFHTPPATAKMNLLPSDIGRPIGHIRPSVAVQNLEDLVRRVIETQLPLHEELRDREDRWHLLRIYPYRVGRQVDGAVIVLVDIDEVRRGQDLLQQQASMLKVADQRKNEFLAMLGHELRNPLGPMANVLQILRLPDSTDTQKEHALGVLDRQLAQLTRIVEDLLDATRISQGKIELRRERLDVSTALRAAVETSRPSLDASGHRFEISFSEETVYVYADPLRLTQVLVNLLNNAAKFTPKNGFIQLACRKGSAPATHVEISVRDNGIGMSPDLLAHVFELFTQGDTYENRRRGGLGIGLTLARTLVEMHGGDISAHSLGEGQGSEFIVRLPLADASALPAPIRQSGIADAPIAGCRIVVIEDNIDQAQTLAALLSLWGYEVKTASEGTAGITLAEEFKPELVLVDLGLPGISGYEVARRLRKHPELKNICIVAQTGWGDTTDRRRTKEAGFDFHLLKPLDPEDLRSVISRRRGEP
jgi:two-component system CheB/CheR fusion protein